MIDDTELQLTMDWWTETSDFQTNVGCRLQFEEFITDDINLELRSDEWVEVG